MLNGCMVSKIVCKDPKLPAYDDDFMWTPRNFLDTSMEEHNTRSLGLNMCKCCNKLWRRLIDRQFASQLTAQASSPEIIIYGVTDPSPVQFSGSSVAAGAVRRENKVSIRGIFLTKWWRKDKQPMLLLYEWC